MPKGDGEYVWVDASKQALVLSRHTTYLDLEMSCGEHLKDRNCFSRCINAACEEVRRRIAASGFFDACTDDFFYIQPDLKIGYWANRLRGKPEGKKPESRAAQDLRALFDRISRERLIRIGYAV